MYCWFLGFVGCLLREFVVVYCGCLYCDNCWLDIRLLGFDIGNVWALSGFVSVVREIGGVSLGCGFCYRNV